MHFVTEADPRRFAGRVRPLLEADPASNVMATVLTSILEGQPADPPPVFAYGLDRRDAVTVAALRVPPRPMLCTALDAAGAERLLDAWLDVDPEPAGINALAPTARLIAAGWERRMGGRARLRMRLALHALQAVTDPPRPAAGRLTRAGPEHWDLLVGWWEAFGAEAGAFVGSAERVVAHRLRRGDQWLWVQPAGEPVSMVATNLPVAGAVRIGPVYTPPGHRNRGYASAAVAAVSRQALSSGARSCMLFTDLGNPTSNHIYADVGYRRFADWEEYELVTAM
jgi:RimJ/RimL family protein N-acetyltransferase